MKAFAGLLLLASLAAQAAAPCRYDYPSYSRAAQLYSEARNGSPQGLLPALAGRLQQLTGCVLTPRELPLARRNAMLQQHQLQLLLLAIQSSELEPLLEFVPLFRLPLQTTVLAGSNYRSADALLADPNARIGILSGALFPTEIEQRLATLRQAGRLEYSNDRGSLYLKLQHRRLQALLETTSWLGSPQGTEGATLRYLSFQPEVYLTVGSYLSRRMSPPDRSQLRQALQRLVASREVSRLTLHYLPQLQGQLRQP
ncbi:hypothetical protein ACFOKJ_01375 [Vogesella amnigena]|uniref:Solute-binding protein family 3/N-terminal domain-containing protein n=1 Tax=Vogesella amnigena TaxID=1507449 RepID=A0ABV7TQZ2_9NEIS